MTGSDPPATGVGTLTREIQPPMAPPGLEHRNEPRHESRRNVLPSALSAVDKYDGHNDAYSWLASFRSLAALCEWEEDDCLKIASIRFIGAAQQWVQPRQVEDWEDFEKQFLCRFGETAETALVRLERCYQKPTESPKNFADRFIEEAERAGRRNDKALMHQFIRHLRSELRLEVTRQRPTSMEEANEFCNYWTGATHNAGEDYLGLEPLPPRRRPAFAEDTNEARPRRPGPLFPRREEADNRAFRPQPRPQERDSYRQNFNKGGPPFNRNPREFPRSNRLEYPRNRGFRPFNPAASAVAQPRPNDATATTVENLARQMEKLQINLNQEAEIRKGQQQKVYRLEAALCRHAQPNTAEHLGLMEDAADPTPAPTTHHTPLELNYTKEGEYDFLVKRQLEGDTPYVRMPQKRVAITPANDSPYNMPRRFTPPPAMPANRIPPPPAQPPTPGPDGRQKVQCYT